MRRQLAPAVVMLLLMTVLTGLIYGLAITGIGQALFPHQADGSPVEVRGKEVGSEYIGQAFVDKDGKPIRKYFQSRPSAATTTSEACYVPSLSLGSNLGTPLP